MKPTFKILPRTDFQRKDGQYGVYLRLTINRKRNYYSLNVSLPEPKKYWDPVNYQIKRYPGVNIIALRDKNLQIENNHNRARQIIFDSEIAKKAISAEEFELLLKAKGDIKTSFFDFARNVIDLDRKLSSETIRSYNSYLSKLKAYRPSLLFSEITIEFIKKYHGYMITSLKNGENTCHKSLSFIRTMLYRAMDEGIINENVFHRKYPLKKVPGKRAYLTDNELYRLEQLYANVPLKNYQVNVLKYFLFCCYCGLRFLDIKALRYKNLKKEVHNGSEETIIRVTMHKTKDPVEIPLPECAIDLIGQGLPNEKVFRVNSNQTTNRYLKESVSLCQIDKKITFHSSRHTFATYCITHGMSMPTVGDLLGHQDYKTTKIYVKIVPTLKIREMNSVWNK